ncbi:MAG: hypothetical protein BGO31_04515 [Bacteroidetes bacterium 43-16]|nr:MAG: hypothetical protein BGO31_04515 [Bacteroidetes bacterium 43-16]
MKQSLLKLVITISLFLVVNIVFAQQPREYRQFIKANFPEFVQHFKHLDFEKFDAGYKTELDLEVTNNVPEDWSAYIKQYKDFLIHNPGKSFAVDLLSAYIDIEFRHGAYYGVSDVDQAVLLVDMKHKRFVQIAFCGPSCEYEDVKWLNDDQFIIVGYFQTDEQQYIPTITFVDLVSKTRLAYMNETNTAKAVYKGKLFKKIRFE